MRASKVLLIDHPVSKRRDRAAAYLSEKGYQLHWASPGKGETLPEEIEDFSGLIVHGGAENLSTDLGSPDRAYLTEELKFLEKWMAADKPLLGICLGSQLIAHSLGAKVTPHPQGLFEIGYVPVRPTAQANGFMPEPMHVYHWHGEGYFEVPKGTELLVEGPVFPNQAFRFGRNTYAIQFHPEVAPETFTSWMDEVEDFASRPGAQPREAQLAAAKAHDEKLYAWFKRFLDGWIAP